MRIDKRRVRSNVKADHQAAEVFRTPAYVYKQLISKYPDYFSGAILDPAAGDGRMIEHILQCGNTNPHCIVDIRQEEAAAWQQRGLIDRLGVDNCIVADYLTTTIDRQYDCLLTNPPFSLAQAFVEKGLQHCGRIVVIQKSSWIGTQKRSQWFLRLGCLKHVEVIPVRPKWELDDRINENFDSHEYFWFVFERGYVGPVMLDWLVESGDGLIAF